MIGAFHTHRFEHSVSSCPRCHRDNRVRDRVAFMVDPTPARPRTTRRRRALKALVAYRGSRPSPDKGPAAAIFFTLTTLRENKSDRRRN
jgi:hypothetical protein